MSSGQLLIVCGVATVTLRRQGRVGATTLRTIERDLDLEGAGLPPA